MLKVERVITITLLASALQLLPLGIASAFDRENNPSAPNQYLSVTVVRIIDGDSMQLRSPYGMINARLCGIDAPEYKQPYGKEAKESLYPYVNKTIRISVPMVDKYRRSIVNAYYGDLFINTRQIRDGHAYHYRKYSSQCEHADRFQEAENDAKLKKVGVWRHGGGEKPWDYRKRRTNRQGS